MFGKFGRSDYIAIAALLVSLIGIPLSSYLSYVSAQKAFQYEKMERSIDTVYKPLSRFLSNATLFGKVVATVSEKYDIDLRSEGAQAEFDKINSQIYSEVYAFGVVDIMINDLNNLKQNGFDVLIREADNKT